MSNALPTVIAAATSGDIDALRAITNEHGAESVRADNDPNELTTLHIAAASGQEAVVAFLLSAEIRADVAALRVNNFSALHAAAMGGHARICALLLESGAELNVQTDPQRYSPLHSAAWGGHLETAKTLLAHGARTDLLNYRGETPAQTALRQGHSVLAQLLESGARATQRKPPWWKFW